MASFLSWLSFGGTAKKVITTPIVKLDPYGLHNLYLPEGSDSQYGPSSVKTDIDIIAVHGLGGDPWATWTETSSGSNWLKEFLPKALPNARIMTFGYNSSIRFSKSVSTIEDFATELLERILLERQKRRTDLERPLIFVCHSLGGIVVKKALILAHEGEERFGFIKKSCRGIVFLGTPHRGSNVANLALILSSIVNSLTLSVAIRKSLLEDLRSDSGILQTVSKQFVRRTKDLQIISFYEREVMGAGSLSVLVVDQDSASLNIMNELTIPINADHHMMCKFAYEGCPKYDLVQGRIVEMVGNILKLKQVVADIPQEEELHWQIYKWLNHESIESENTYRSKLDERENGTCLWFWKHSGVNDWLSTGDSSILWVHGAPGAGKSVLCSSIISKLLDEQKSVAYFFCVASQRSETDSDSTAPELNSPEFILRSLIVQLLEGDPCFRVPNELRNLYKRRKKRLQLGDLKKILQCILDIHPRVYIIIDGLDEVDELDQVNPGQLKRLFKSLDLEPLGIVKWLFINQKTKAVDEELIHFKKNQQGSVAYRELDLAEVDSELKDEIKTLFKTAVEEKFSDSPDGFKRYILEPLVALTGGNFLCAKLLSEDLKDCPSLGDFFKSMMAYQPGLENHYLRALRRMASVKTPSWTDAAKKTLMYIALALKPLTICEVQKALSIDVKVAGGQCGRSGMFATDIAKLCLPLATVCKEKRALKLVHHSLKAFLTKQLGSFKDLDTTGIEDFFVDKEKGNTSMALVCLSYLSEDRYSSFPQIDEDSLSCQTSEQVIATAATFDKECEKETNKFIKYAAIFWHRHADAAEITPDLVNLVIKFIRSPNFITCLRIQSLYASYNFGTFVSNGGSSVAFADTIPGWLESTKFQLGTEGKEIAFQYYSFVKEWGHVLARYPGEIERCLIGTLGSIFFSPVETIADAYFLDEGEVVKSVDVDAQNFMSMADLEGEGWILTLKFRSNTPDTGSDWTGSTQSECTPSESAHFGITQSLQLWHYDRGSKPAPQLRWLLPDVVNFTSGNPPGRFKNLNCCNHPLKNTLCVGWPSIINPLVTSPALDYAIVNGYLFKFREPGSAEMHNLQNPLIKFGFPSVLCTPLGICLGTHGHNLAIGAAWECEKCVPDDDELDEADDDGESDNGSSSGIDSDVAEDTSVFLGTGFASPPPTTSYGCFKLLIYDTGKLEQPVLLHEFSGHCRVNNDINPFQYASPAFHPNHPLVAWAPGSGEIIVADFKTGAYKILRTVKISPKSHAIARELHFSEGGNLLYEVKITVKITEDSSSHSGEIYLTTYPVDNPSSPHSQVQSFNWKLQYCKAKGRELKPPTTTWTADSVYVSFSNIGLSVCRINLLPNGARLYMAKTAMALPASALRRSVHFIPLAEKDAIVVLGGSVGLGASLISSKELLGWDERDWYSEINLTVTGGGDKGVFYECDEPSFTVPVRSGEVWTERKVLRCS